MNTSVNDEAITSDPRTGYPICSCCQRAVFFNAEVDGWQHDTFDASCALIGRRA